MNKPPIYHNLINKKCSENLMHLCRLGIKIWQCNKTSYRVHEHDFSKKKVWHPLVQEVRIEDFPNFETGVRGLSRMPAMRTVSDSCFEGWITTYLAVGSHVRTVLNIYNITHLPLKRCTKTAHKLN